MATRKAGIGLRSDRRGQGKATGLSPSTAFAAVTMSVRGRAEAVTGHAKAVTVCTQHLDNFWELCSLVFRCVSGCFQILFPHLREWHSPVYTVWQWRWPHRSRARRRCPCHQWRHSQAARFEAKQCFEPTAPPGVPGKLENLLQTRAVCFSPEADGKEELRADYLQSTARWWNHARLNEAFLKK